MSAPPGLAGEFSRVRILMSGWLASHHLLFVVVLATLVRLVLYSAPQAPGPKSDQERFVYQAEHLLAGEGFLFHGEPCTHLPPGYPVFLAAVFSVRHSDGLVVFVQFLLSIASCVLLYLAVLPRSRGWALFSATLLALHAWSARYDWLLMSECFGEFLVASLVYLISRLEMDPGSTAKRSLLAGLIGMIATAAVLTSPGTIFLAAGVVAVNVFANFRRPTVVFAMFLGAAILMGPWQIHCYRVVGRIVPQILTTSLREGEGYQSWERTWAQRTKAPHASARGYFIWDTPGSTIDQVPRAAFRSDEERAELQRIAEQWKRDSTPITERYEFFRPIAAERKAESPFRYYVLLPLVRSALLWLEMPSVSHAQMEFVGRLTASSLSKGNPERAKPPLWQSVGKALLSNAVFALHLFFLLTAIAFALGGLASRRPMAIALVAGVAGYTAISSYLGVSEFRRNLLFIPVLLFLAFYWPGARVGPQSGER